MTLAQGLAVAIVIVMMALFAWGRWRYDLVAVVALLAGVIVGIRYEGDTDVERYLLGSIEERVEGVEVMSPGSALGMALVGAKIGDTVEYETPTGAKLKVEIVTIGD